MNISLLPDGSVIFDDVSSQVYTGEIAILSRKPKKNESFSGDRAGEISAEIEGETTSLSYNDE